MTYGPRNQAMLEAGFPKSSLSHNGAPTPVEPPMSPKGKSYYSKGDDPREGNGKKPGKP